MRRERTASVMALVSNICGQRFADATLVFMEAIENDHRDERNGDESSNQRKDSFTQKEHQPQPVSTRSESLYTCLLNFMFYIKVASCSEQGVVWRSEAAVRFFSIPSHAFCLMDNRSNMKQPQTL